MTKREEANTVISKYVKWSMGSGALPIPLLDVAIVTKTQLNMIQELCELYGVDYSRQTAKNLLTALAGGALARLGASAIKGIPLIGSLIGGGAMVALSGASTYAMGRVFVNHLESGEPLVNFDLGKGSTLFSEALEKGKGVAQMFFQNRQNRRNGRKAEKVYNPYDEDIEYGPYDEQEYDEHEGQSLYEEEDVFEKLEKLGKLREKGFITDEEFQSKKEELLGQV